MLTGDYALAINVSVIFELFWLDLIPAGTFIPPNTAASNLCCLFLLTGMGAHAPSEAVFPILLCLPLGWLGAKLEDMLRQRQNLAYDSLLKWTRGEEGASGRPGALVLRALLVNGAAHFFFFLAAAVCLTSLVGFLQGLGLLQPPRDFLTWGHLWLAASFGGVLSLRSAKAYAVLALGLTAVLVNLVL